MFKLDSNLLNALLNYCRKQIQIINFLSFVDYSLKVKNLIFISTFFVIQGDPVVVVG